MTHKLYANFFFLIFSFLGIRVKRIYMQKKDKQTKTNMWNNEGKVHKCNLVKYILTILLFHVFLLLLKLHIFKWFFGKLRVPDFCVFVIVFFLLIVCMKCTNVFECIKQFLHLNKIQKVHVYCMQTDLYSRFATNYV